MLFQEGGQSYNLLKFIVIGVNMPEDMYVFDTLFVRFCDSFCFASHFYKQKCRTYSPASSYKSILVFYLPNLALRLVSKASKNSSV